MATKTIELPADHRLHLVPTDIGHELVERGPAILRTGETVVDILNGGPAARVDVASQLEQLVLAGLVLVLTRA